MGNARREAQNATWVSGALGLNPQSATPGDLGANKVPGIYINSGDGSIRYVNASGVEVSLTTSGSVAALRCRAGTNAVLPNGAVVYANGTLGVGATITAGANASLNTAGIDGLTNLAVGDYVLVKDQASGLQNGIYKVTSLGSAGSKWVLTRAPEFDTSAEIKDGTLITVGEGTANADTAWLCTVNGTVTVGTTAITFARESGVMLLGSAQTVTAAKTFADATLKQNNAAGTFAHTVASSATAARVVTLPDASLTVAQAAVATAAGGTGASGSTAPGLTDPGHNHGGATGAEGTGATGGTAPAFTGTAATSGSADHLTGVGMTAVGQVMTSTDNKTVGLNELAGMFLVTATTNSMLYIASNAVAAGAPVAITVLGTPVTDAGAYKVLRGPTPVGTVASHTHTGPSHTHTVASGTTGATVDGHTHTGPSHTHTQS